MEISGARADPFVVHRGIEFSQMFCFILIKWMNLMGSFIFFGFISLLLITFSEMTYYLFFSLLGIYKPSTVAQLPSTTKKKGAAQDMICPTRLIRVKLLNNNTMQPG